MTTGLPIASLDVDARRTFREELRGRRVALRSFLDRDDIDDVDIIQPEDPEVSATRQVLKVDAPVSAVVPVGTRADATGEIDAADVLESIDVLACAPPEVSVTSTAPLAAVTVHERAPYLAIDPDDAFFAHADSPSTGAVTFHLGDSYVDEIGPTMELHGRDERRRRLGWLVGTVLTCAAVMTAAAAITAETQRPPTADAPTTTPLATTSLKPALAGASATKASSSSPSIPEMEVRNLPPAMAGTIVGPPHRVLFVDGKRLQSSSAVLACGKHSVRIGFHAARIIDVPCGGTLPIR